MISHGFHTSSRGHYDISQSSCGIPGDLTEHPLQPDVSFVIAPVCRGDPRYHTDLSQYLIDYSRTYAAATLKYTVPLTGLPMAPRGIPHTYHGVPRIKQKEVLDSPRYSTVSHERTTLFHFTPHTTYRIYGTLHEVQGLTESPRYLTKCAATAVLLLLFVVSCRARRYTAVPLRERSI